MSQSCIACGHTFGPSELRMSTPLGDVCMSDASPAYNVRVGDTVHHVIAWRPEVLERINARAVKP